MLEILYDTETKIVRGWNADPASMGNFNPSDNQAIVIFDIDPPDFISDPYYVDLENQVIVVDPDYVPPYTNGGGATAVITEIEVFRGTSPTDWTDLDLSSVIGAQATLVVLKFNGSGTNIAVRKNGDTDNFYGGVTNAQGCSLTYAYPSTLLITTTFTSGVIEWKCLDATTVVINVVAYIK